jgi:hypothetical protein
LNQDEFKILTFNFRREAPGKPFAKSELTSVSRAIEVQLSAAILRSFGANKKGLDAGNADSLKYTERAHISREDYSCVTTEPTELQSHPIGTLSGDW